MNPMHFLVERAISMLFMAVACFALNCGVTSCREPSLATSSDKEAMARLQQKWGTKYYFDLTSDTYWKARLKANIPYDDQELRAILDEFTAGRTRNDSAYVYMNVYDARGEFITQFYRDTDGVIKKSNAEYY